MADYISSLDGPSMDDALEQMNQRLPEQWTTGQIDGEDVPEDNPRYHNNAKYYAEVAEGSVPHQPIIQSNKWYVWNPLTSQYEDSGVKATGVKVSNIRYQEGSSPIYAPTGTWHTTPVTVGQGKYLWTRITFDDSSVAYTVARQGVDGQGGQWGSITGNIQNQTDLANALNGKSAKAISFTITLTTAGWEDNEQTISDARFVVSGYDYFVSPTKTSAKTYAESFILCDDSIIEAGKLTFYCDSEPATPIQVMVSRIEVA